MRVSCFGSNNSQPRELYDQMKLVGNLLSLRGVGIATGAFGGLGMQAPAEGAVGAGSKIPVVGYTFGSRQPNPYITEVVDCRVLSNGIPFDADYCVRLAGLLSSDAFIVAGNGGPGTFLELVAVINFNQKFWKPMKRVAILDVEVARTWNHSMLQALKSWGVLNDHTAGMIRVVRSADSAVRWVCEGIE
jgi:predicted Rossmann-fold nucleotide-binding protein